jgi:parvulin-like peptidyl-prolyl isomerase
MAIIFERGKLLARADGQGIYQADVLRAAREEQDRAGNELGQTAKTNRSRLLSLVATVRLRNRAVDESIAAAAIDREYDALRFQLRPEEAWTLLLQANSSSPVAFRREVARNLKGRDWLERQIAGRISVSTDECRRYYETHPALFMQPARFRANHLFVAAPPETPPDVVEAKQGLITALSQRLSRGEKLPDLAGTASEDEATKMRGGDLNFFSEVRMPPDFIEAVKGMAPGQISPIVRTRLGFHIIQLTTALAARQMTFEETETEIRTALENEHRGALVAGLETGFSQQVDFVDSSLR